VFAAAPYGGATRSTGSGYIDFRAAIMRAIFPTSPACSYECRKRSKRTRHPEGV